MNLKTIVLALGLGLGLLAFPALAVAQYGHGCEGGSAGDLCLTFYGESGNDPRVGFGWVVEEEWKRELHRKSEMWVYFDTATRQIYVGESYVLINEVWNYSTNQYEDQPYHQDPYNEWTYGGVPCYDAQAQNARYAQFVRDTVWEGIAAGLAAAPVALAAGAPAWQAVLLGSVGYIYSNQLIDATRFLYACYWRR